MDTRLFVIHVCINGCMNEKDIVCINDCMNGNDIVKLMLVVRANKYAWWMVNISWKLLIIELNID